MSLRKGQNSIIVLATLGVYFGLVLAGSAPQIMAQAAMTRQFDVRDEIEYRDGLDKKPEDDAAAAKASLDDYLSRLKTLITELNTLHRPETGSDLGVAFSASQVFYTPCIAGDRPLLLSANFKSISRADVKATAQKALSLPDVWQTLSECTPQKAGGGRDYRRAEAASSLNANNLLFTSAITKSSPSHAEYLASIFNDSLAALDRGDTVVDVLIKNTSITTAENQVVIITHLPRAALDPLISVPGK